MEPQATRRAGDKLPSPQRNDRPSAAARTIRHTLRLLRSSGPLERPIGAHLRAGRPGDKLARTRCKVGANLLAAICKVCSQVEVARLARSSSKAAASSPAQKWRPQTVFGRPCLGPNLRPKHFRRAFMAANPLEQAANKRPFTVSRQSSLPASLKSVCGTAEARD